MTKPNVLALAAALLMFLPASFTLLAQKKPEKPKVHPDFYFGSDPSSRDTADLMAKENVRLLLVGFHVGWDVDKIAKELKLSADELNKIYDELEEQRLAGKRSADDDGVRPLLPVIRERDFDRVKDSLGRHTEEFSRVLQAVWGDIESTASSLSGANGVP